MVFRGGTVAVCVGRAISPVRETSGSDVANTGGSDGDTIARACVFGGVMEPILRVVVAAAGRVVCRLAVKEVGRGNGIHCYKPC